MTYSIIRHFSDGGERIVGESTSAKVARVGALKLCKSAKHSRCGWIVRNAVGTTLAHFVMVGESCVDLIRELGWSAKWPTIPGWYWFYGDTSPNNHRPVLHTVCVWGSQADPDNVLDNNYLRYEINHTFMQRHATGLWLPLPEPVLPVIE